jgi:hypothetical protein
MLTRARACNFAQPVTRARYREAGRLPKEDISQAHHTIPHPGLAESRARALGGIDTPMRLHRRQGEQRLTECRAFD